jgi:hypothetical protein
MARARKRTVELEEHVARAREILFATEREAARLRRELVPTEDVPFLSERVLQALDWINAWVSKARVVHRLAERELARLNERRL